MTALDADLRIALGEGRLEEAAGLLEQGASFTLAVAAGLGRHEDINRLLKTADEAMQQDALALAAINAHATPLRILLDNGVEPNRHCPAGLGPSRTPLLHATATGSLGAVCTLVTRRASLSLGDRETKETAVELARRLGFDELLTFFDHAKLMLPAFEAVSKGAVDDLAAWVAAHPDHVNDRLGDNPRTLLHMTADWPGPIPRGAESVKLLVGAGADIDARFHMTHGETPLHWAASTDDVEVADALIAHGSDVDINGGCMADGSPLFLALAFKNWRVAEALLDAGAHVRGHDIDFARLTAGLEDAPPNVRQAGLEEIATSQNGRSQNGRSQNGRSQNG